MPARRSASSISGQTVRCASTYSSMRSGRTSRTNALRWVMRVSLVVNFTSPLSYALATDEVPRSRVRVAA